MGYPKKRCLDFFMYSSDDMFADELKNIFMHHLHEITCYPEIDIKVNGQVQ